MKYQYDVDSNRTAVLNRVAGDVEVHEIDSASQRLLAIQRGPDTDLDGVIDGTPDSETVYSYTAAGELAVETTINNVTGAVVQKEYLWSAKGELLQVDIDDEDADTDPDYTIQYAYDDRGTLVERKSWLEGQESSAVTERYLVDYENPTGYSQVLAEMRAEGDGDFVLARVNTYSDDLRAESTLMEHAGAGAGGGGPPAFAHVPGVQFPLRDALGTVRASAGFGSGLTPGQASINDYRYSAFGLPLGESLAPADASTRGSLTSQSAPSPWAFTGQRIDPATGLQYHRARWLDMALGRWASVDPVWDWPGNAGHSYLQTGARPLTSTDLLGSWTLAEQLSVVSSVQTIAASAIGIIKDINFYTGHLQFATSSWFKLLDVATQVAGFVLLAGFLLSTGRKIITYLVSPQGRAFLSGVVQFLKMSPKEAWKVFAARANSTYTTTIPDIGRALKTAEDFVENQRFCMDRFSQARHLFFEVGRRSVPQTGEIDTIFVVLKDGTVRFADRNEVRSVMGWRRFSHNMLANAEEVIAAGEAKFVNGVLRSFNNQSGHFKPSADSVINAIGAFSHNGVKLDGGLEFAQLGTWPTATDLYRSDSLYHSLSSLILTVNLGVQNE